MRILHIHHSMHTGGVEAMVCGLVNELSKSEDVTLCTWFDIDSQSSVEKKISKRVKRVVLGNKELTSWTKLKDVFLLYKVIKKGNYDIVHIHGAFNYYILAAFLLHRKSVFFYTIHSDAYMENGPMSNKFLFLKQKYFQNRWIHPITISPASQVSFYKLYQCDSIMIQNGIEPPQISINKNLVDNYKLTSNTKILVHVGRICVAKNQLVLCKVFKRLIDEGNDICLLIVGPREIESIWEDINPYFSDRIIYLGERNDVSDLLSQATGMCLPSIYEGLPITLLESLSVGCIPICSPVGGISNVVEDGVNGVLSKDSSEEEYYIAMKRFLKLPIDALDCMKKNAKSSFENYDIHVTAEKYAAAYKKELNGKLRK